MMTIRGKKQDFYLRNALKINLYSLICIIYMHIYAYIYTYTNVPYVKNLSLKAFNKFD